MAQFANRFAKPVRYATRSWSRVKRLKPYRVYINFSHNDGNLMAAGMSYQSLFAVFAGVWVGFSVAGIWLHSVPALEQELIELINRAVPGLIGPEGAIKTSQLPSSLTFGWTGIIAIIALLWTAIAWLFYTRQAVRAMFGLGRDTTNYALQKVRDLGLAAVFGLVLVASAVISVLSTKALELVMGLFGMATDSPVTTFAARSIGFLVALGLNWLVLMAMFRLLSRISIPWRDLIFGSFIGSIALSAVSIVGSLIVGGGSKNPLLASFGIFIGLLIWFVLVCRIMLLAASWIAVGMADRNVSPIVLSPDQQAAERAADEHRARLLVARADVARAEDDLANARWLGRFGAERRLEKARDRLDELLDGHVTGAR